MRLVIGRAALFLAALIVLTGASGAFAETGEPARAGAASSHQNPARWPFAEAWAALKSEAYDPVISQTTAAIDTGALPEDKLIIAHYLRGRAYLGKRDYDRAIRDFDLAIQRRPDWLYAIYFARGVAFEENRLYRRAVKDYDHVIRLRPDHARAFAGRGVAKHNLGLFHGAIRDFDQAIRIVPDQASVLFGRGHAYMAQGKFVRAISDFDQAIRNRPKRIWPLFYRGGARFFQREFAEAAADFRRCLAIGSGGAYVVAWLYLAEQRIGENARANLERNARKLDLSVWPGPVVAMFLGRMSARQMRAAAEKVDQKKLKERQIEAFFYTGEHHLLSGDDAKARKFFRMAVDTGVYRYIEHTAARAQLGWLGEPVEWPQNMAE